MGNEQDDKNHRPRVESTDDEKKSSATTKVKKVPLPIKAALLIGVVLFLLPKIHIFDLIPYLVIVFLFMIVSLFTVAAGELGDQDGGPYFFISGLLFLLNCF